MNSGLEAAFHLFIGELANQVAGHELVFQAVIDQVFRSDAAIQKSFDLICHPCSQALVQAAVNALAPLVPGDRDSDKFCLLGEVFAPLHGVGALPDCDFQGADQPAAGVVVSMVMERLKAGQARYQGLIVIFLKLCSQGGVGRYVGQGVAAAGRLYVKAAPSAYYRSFATLDNAAICPLKVALILVYVVFGACIDYVNQMVRDIAV